MSCPTCDHTVQLLDAKWYWCPRCGSVFNNGLRHFDAPKLVERCREFAKTIIGDCAEHMYQWKATGIAESINTPENR